MRRAVVVASLTSCAAFGAIAWLSRESAQPRRLEAALGDAAVVESDYTRWKEAFEAGPRVVSIALRHSKALSRERGFEIGEARFDLDARRVDVSAADVCEDLDVWLVENVDGERRSVAPEAGDRFAKLGTLRATGGESYFEADLEQAASDSLRVDLVVVTRAGRDPARDARLTGQPGLFERLWSAERAASSDARTGMILATATQAGNHAGARGRNLVDLVAEGEDLFFNETFQGNGRTCGTCHPAENNFTIDRDFIATMPPNDPLFVAEFDPQLMQNLATGERFETPELMHQFGLITINPDGFDDLANRFVLRAVSHTFEQALSTTAPSVAVQPPRARTGWGGDGSPGSGTLREFATGAVVQHFPRKMARVAGEDFQLPTDHQLDAIEAFMLSLGRRFEMDVNAMQFVSANVQNGLASFAQCQICHLNAGANSNITQVGNTVVGVGNPSGTANGNFDTGIERFLRNHPDGTGIVRPTDGGFGVIPIDPVGPPGPGGLVPNDDGGFGDKTFNTQSLAEFADTVPGFHNNLTALAALGNDPIEGAVRFYTTPEFGQSRAGQLIFGGPLVLSITQIKDIALFLRAINALENVRAVRHDLLRAALAGPEDAGDPAANALFSRRLRVARSNAVDGRDVLQEVNLHPDAVAVFAATIQFIDNALDESRPWPMRLNDMHRAYKRVLDVRGKILLNP